MTAAGPFLAFDTATTRAVAAVGRTDGRLLAETTWTAGYRHGEELLARVDLLLAEAGVELAGLGAIVVGTGPGAFTGLRVGLATAKGLAHALGVPIVGVPTRSALLAAAARLDPSVAPFVLALPAGPTDRLFIEPDGRTAILAAVAAGGPDDDSDALRVAAVGRTLVAVDLAGRAAPSAVALGERARTGLAAALVGLGAAELAAGRSSDLAELVPDYVSLPRGVGRETGAVGWSRDPA